MITFDLKQAAAVRRHRADRQSNERRDGGCRAPTGGATTRTPSSSVKVDLLAAT